MVLLLLEMPGSSDARLRDAQLHGYLTLGVLSSRGAQLWGCLAPGMLGSRDAQLPGRHRAALGLLHCMQRVGQGAAAVRTMCLAAILGNLLT